MNCKDDVTNIIKKLSDKIIAIEKANASFLSRISQLQFGYLKKRQETCEVLASVDPFYIQKDLNNHQVDLSCETKNSKLLDLFFRQLITFRTRLILDETLISVLRKEHKMTNIFLLRVFSFDSQFRNYHTELLMRVIKPELPNVKIYKTVLFYKLIYGYLDHNPSVFIGLICLLDNLTSSVNESTTDDVLLLKFVVKLIENPYIQYLRYYLSLVMTLLNEKNDPELAVLGLVDAFMIYIVENFDNCLFYTRNYYNSFTDKEKNKNLVLRMGKCAKAANYSTIDILTPLVGRIKTKSEDYQPSKLTNHYVSITVSDCRTLIEFMAQSVSDFSKYSDKSIRKSFKTLIVQVKVGSPLQRTEYQTNLLNVVEKIKMYLLTEYKHLYYLNMMADCETVQNNILLQRFQYHAKDISSDDQQILKELEFEIDVFMHTKLSKKINIFVLTSSIMQSQLALATEPLKFDSLRLMHLYKLLDKNRLEVVLMELAKITHAVLEKQNFLKEALKQAEVQYNCTKAMLKHIKRVLIYKSVGLDVARVIEQRKLNFIVRIELSEKHDNTKNLVALRLSSERLGFKNRLLLNARLSDGYIEEIFETLGHSSHKQAELNHLKQIFKFIKKYNLLLLSLKREDIKDFLTNLVTQLCEEVYDVVILVINKNIGQEAVKAIVSEYLFDEFYHMILSMLRSKILDFSLPDSSEIINLFSGWTWDSFNANIADLQFLETALVKFKSIKQLKTIFTRINVVISQIIKAASNNGEKIQPKVI